MPVPGADIEVLVAVLVLVEEVVADPAPSLRREPLPAEEPRDELLERQRLGDVRVQLQLEERHRAARPVPVRDHEEVIELLHERGEVVHVVVAEPPRGIVPLEVLHQPVGVVEGDAHAARLLPDEGAGRREVLPLADGAGADLLDRLAPLVEDRVPLVPDDERGDVGEAGVEIVGALDEALKLHEERSRGPHQVSGAGHGACR